MYNKIRDLFIHSYLAEFEYEIAAKKDSYLLSELDRIRIKYPIAAVYSKKALMDISKELLDTSLKDSVIRWAIHLNYILISEGVKKEVTQFLVEAVDVQMRLLSDRDQDLLKVELTNDVVMSDPILLWIGLFSIYFPSIPRVTN